MTSTHLDVASPLLPADPLPESTSDRVHSPSADSSFSDAYKEEMQESKGEEQVVVKTGSDVSDDYAMTFDSDGEEHADSQDISHANVKPEITSLSIQTTSPATAPTIHEPTESASHPDSNALPIPPNPSYIQPQSEKPVEAAEDIVAQIPVESTSNTSYKYEDIASGDIDIQQLLDNITANAEKNEPLAAATIPSSTPIVNGPLPTHSSLPPRPNVSQTRHVDDVPKYYTGNAGLPPAASSYRPPGAATALIAAGAPGTSTDPRGGLPPPPTASFRAPGPPPSTTSLNTASQSQTNQPTIYSHQPLSIEEQEEADELDAKWGPEVQKIYDQFLESERGYVTEGLWDRFPLGSRLFIGNLPSEKVTKRDIFHVFHPYGRIAQISIKQAYGFVQFHDSSSCYRALDQEQGTEVRGKRVHLEISKPQKNTRNVSGSGPPAVRRSRSPDYNRGDSRGNNSDRGGRQAQGHNGDRYDGRAQPVTRQDEYGRPLRTRDDYRPVRHATPPRELPRSREEFGHRGRDSYDGRDRRRSRSPIEYRDQGRYRERSLSPRAREAFEDEELEIPRRDPRAVPDVQIILLDQLDRAFVSWVETEIRNRGVKVEVMFLSPRLPLQAVVRRQIVEGVHAVSKLDMRSQNMSKIPLQVFDRQAGADAVRFDEYQDLDPKIAAELVLRAKQPPSQAQPQQYAPQYDAPQYSAPQPQYQPPAQAPAVPNLASLVGQLDNATLQKLLSGLNTPQQQNVPAVAANSQIDLAGLLGGYVQQQPPQQPRQHPYQPAPADPYANLANNPALASLLGGNAPAPVAAPPMHAQQSAQQVQNIMAQLARFRQ